MSDALKDLLESSGDARHEGFPTLSGLAPSYAERLLKAMYEITPRRLEVYPTPDGEIAIDAPDGGALYLANLRDTLADLEHEDDFDRRVE